MNTLQIQDAFQPYYAGREEARDGSTASAGKPDTGPDRQRRAARQLKDDFQASRQKRKLADSD